MLVLDGLVGFHRTLQLQLLQLSWSGHRLGLPWKQTDHSVIFETVPMNCILDSFVDYVGYSISSKGYNVDIMPTVVDIMVIFWSSHRRR